MVQLRLGEILSELQSHKAESAIKSLFNVPVLLIFL